MTSSRFGGGPVDLSSDYLVVRKVSSGDTKILGRERYALQEYGTWAPTRS